MNAYVSTTAVAVMPTIPMMAVIIVASEGTNIVKLYEH